MSCSTGDNSAQAGEEEEQKIMPREILLLPRSDKLNAQVGEKYAE
jgi:hypothetical protein